MKFFWIALNILFLLSGCGAKIQNNTTRDITIPPQNQFIPNQFQSLWNEIKSDKYQSTKLPHYIVTYDDMKNQIEGDAIRTLNDKRDLLDSFDKLAHPNGICLKGIWQIYETNPQNRFSGYFSNGSKALVIARASSASSNISYKDNRSFGLAIKLFATTNPNKINKSDSANIFTIDDLGGNTNSYFAKAKLTNEPPISFSWDLIKNIFFNLKLTRAFGKADKNAGIRQLYEISYLEANTTNITTPKWIKIELITQTPQKDDFRDELKIEENNNLIFRISLSSQLKSDSKDIEWLEVGKIIFDESATSYSCDKRLHFHHPKFRDDLVY
jgi:hypothetical protein